LTPSAAFVILKTVPTVETVATPTPVPTRSTVSTVKTVPGVETIATAKPISGVETVSTVETVATSKPIPGVETVSTVETVATESAVPTISPFLPKNRVDFAVFTHRKRRLCRLRYCRREYSWEKISKNLFARRFFP
jgi:hypothetical protein